MAYIYDINKNSIDSHQVSPRYVITVLRWKNRDTINYDENEAGGSLETRDPMVILNDCVNLSVIDAKSQPTTIANIDLLQGDINYATAIAPGDMFIVNIVDGDKKANNIYYKAINEKPINHVNDGFKGIFRVSNVERSIITAADGKKMFVAKIQGKSFKELSNKIYFDKQLQFAGELQNNFFWASRISKEWKDFYGKKNGQPTIHEILRFLLLTFIGNGLNINGENAKIGGEPFTRNQIWKLPSKVGALLNNKNAKYAVDLYNIRMGIERYTEKVNPRSKIDISTGFNPTNFRQNGRFLESPYANDDYNTLQGRGILEPDYWNNVTLWSVLLKYLNVPINEIFTSNKVGTDGFVYPTLIARQKPFTSNAYGKNKKYGAEKLKNHKTLPHTRFLNLPRWRISPDLIYNFKESRSDDFRFNFVKLDGRVTVVNKDPKVQQTENLGKGNYEIDTEDIIRNGLRPYMQTTNFDFQKNNSAGTLTPLWAKLISDWVVGQHLKMNGAMTCAGIFDPISVGDNLQLSDMVYHIESISHNLQVNQNGLIQYRTNITFSQGVSTRSNEDYNIYGQMDFTDSYSERLNDDTGMLPGFSETQDIPSRKKTKGEEISETKEESFNPNGKKKNNRKG